MDKESVVLGCGCEVFGDEAEELKQRFRLLRLLIVSTALSMPLLWDLPPHFQFMLATVLQFGPGLYFVRNAIRGLKNRSLGMDLLVALSTTAIYVYSTVVAFTVTENIKLYYLCDGVLISLLLFGRYLESVAIYQSGEAVRGLLRLQPKTAIVLRDGVETEIDAAEIVSGDTILLRPGERIPADGKILEGSCLVDESLLTGESEPVEKGPGDSITGGTLDREGKVTYTATSVGEDSTLQQMAAFVRRAQSEKAPVQRFADRIASIFVPSVIALAVLIFALWFTLLAPGEWGKAVSTICGVLVIACPCALGLATPAALMTASGRAAELGILFKGSAIEKAWSIDTVVFDKTGTLERSRAERLLDLGCAALTVLLVWLLLCWGGASPEIGGASFGALFLVGLSTSPHCLGMCGGILLSACAGREGRKAQLGAALGYNGGRMISYTVLGTVPLMLLFASLGALLPRGWTKYLRKLGAVLVTSMGLKMLIGGLLLLQ